MELAVLCARELLESVAYARPKLWMSCGSGSLTKRSCESAACCTARRGAAAFLHPARDSEAINAPVQAPDGRLVLAEVIGFRNDITYLVPYETPLEVRPGLQVMHLGHGLLAPVGDGLMGRVLDGLGRPIDGRGPLQDCVSVPLCKSSPAPLDRTRIREPFVTGQRALDSLLTFGKGQRIGVFSGSGVGKSTLLGEIAKGAANADVNVVVLVGEPRSRSAFRSSKTVWDPRGWRGRWWWWQPATRRRSCAPGQRAWP